MVATYRAQPNLLEERVGDQNVVLLDAMGKEADKDRCVTLKLQIGLFVPGPF